MTIGPGFHASVVGLSASLASCFGPLFVGHLVQVGGGGYERTQCSGLHVRLEMPSIAIPGKHTVPTFSRSWVELRNFNSVALSGDIRICCSLDSIRPRLIAVGSGLATPLKDALAIFER